jgi:uncharacterized delta-60 repeat protein
VMRRLADGGPDPSFSGDGAATVGLGSSGYVGSVALGGDGSVFAGGSGTTAEEKPAGAVLKLRPDGEPDPAFGAGGVVLTRFYGRRSRILDVAAGAAGLTAVGSLGRGLPVLARFDAAGALDAGFSGDGQVRARVTDSFSGLGSLVLQSDGKALVAGALNGDGRVVRYRVNGKPDRSFAAGGALIGFGGNLDSADDLAIGPDGRIAVLGERGVSGFRSNDYELAAARLLAGGRRHDLDADGRVDDRDLCPRLPATAHRGCPFFKRTISISYTPRGVFEGRIRSDNHRCVGGDGRVRVLQRVSGPDPVVGGPVRTPGRGTYAIRVPDAEGTYYAKVEAAVDDSAGLCGAARSDPITVG